MLALLWLAATVFGAIAGRLGIPPVIGELACGLLLGPFLLGWVEPAPTLKALAEIGVVLLLFEVGMDLTQVDCSDPGFARLLGALLAVAIAGKWVAGFVLRKPPLIRHAVGLAMVPRGEVGLIFIQVGATIGLLDSRIGAALLVVVAVTTLLPPIALKLLYRFNPSKETT